ncbi:MAG: hypothetical protein R2728_15195 [Chitinophagales bacterium]
MTATHGKFLIDVQEGRNEDLEADYVQVNFHCLLIIKLATVTFM